MKNFYSPLFFKRGLPEWKRKKDPFLSQFFYRPISFVTSSIFASLGCSANTVSYLTIIVSFAASAFYFFDSHTMHIWGAIMVNLWLLLDCTDGNIARCVKKQPFGVFADATACYTLIAFIYPAMGYAVYLDGGYFFEAGSILIVILGSLVSCSDLLLRLVFHKFREGEIELNKVRNVKDNWLDEYKPHKQSIKARLIAAVNPGGYQPVFILLGTLFYFLDIVLLFCLVIDAVGLIFYLSVYIRKAIKLSKEYQEIYQKEWLNA